MPRGQARSRSRSPDPFNQARGYKAYVYWSYERCLLRDRQLIYPPIHAGLFQTHTFRNLLNDAPRRSSKNSTRAAVKAAVKPAVKRKSRRRRLPVIGLEGWKRELYPYLYSLRLIRFSFALEDGYIYVLMLSQRATRNRNVSERGKQQAREQLEEMNR